VTAVAAARPMTKHHLLRVRGKIHRSLAERGLSGTLAYVPRYIVGVLDGLRPERRRKAAAILARELAFDRERDVDTAGVVHLSDVGSVVGRRDLGHYYHGTDPALFQNAMDLIPIDHSKYLFIDFGSGKGKALLLASEWPFKAIIGLEFAPALHRIAETNLKRDRGAGRRCADRRSICIDATRYELPPEPGVLFCYNPFSRAVLATVMEGVGRSLRAHPRDLWVCYVHPYAHQPLNDAPFLRLVTADPRFRIYTVAPPAGARANSEDSER
jgi:hypothetical protein